MHGKIRPITVPRCSEGSRKLRFPDNVTLAQNVCKVVRLTHRPFLPPPQVNTPGTHFCYKLYQPQGHSAIGRLHRMCIEITQLYIPRHRFFLVCLCLKANAEMVPKIRSCHYMLLM